MSGSSPVLRLHDKPAVCSQANNPMTYASGSQPIQFLGYRPRKNTTSRRKSPDSEYLVGAPTCSKHQTVENDRRTRIQIPVSSQAIIDRRPPATPIRSNFRGIRKLSPGCRGPRQSTLSRCIRQPSRDRAGPADGDDGPRLADLRGSCCTAGATLRRHCDRRRRPRVSIHG